MSFQTTPGNMTYEAMVHYKSYNKKVIETNLKTVSILTAYGDRPHCVAEHPLKGILHYESGVFVLTRSSAVATCSSYGSIWCAKIWYGDRIIRSH